MLCLDLRYPDRICFRYILRHIWKMKLYLALVFELCLGDNHTCHTFVSHIRESVAKLRIAKIRCNVILLVAVERNIKRHRKSDMVHNKVTRHFFYKLYLWTSKLYRAIEYSIFQLLYMNLQILIIFLLKVAEGSGLKLAFRMLLL